MSIKETREIKKVNKERFLSKIDKKSDDECWMWLGTVATGGYGRFQSYKNRYLAHRISYFIHHGHVDKNLLVDHICRNRLCVNPKHLRQVDERTNTLENSAGPAYMNKIKEYCIHGHEYSKENTGFDPKKTRRYCLLCKKESNRLYRLKNKKRD